MRSVIRTSPPGAALIGTAATACASHASQQIFDSETGSLGVTHESSIGRSGHGCLWPRRPIGLCALGVMES
jgi:hypothetical protein